jgi:predicted 2-oxoglutarate/Fe(II)-dependent dioxygenase YbiX
VAPLRARAQLAPFGRGEQTVIDTAVRRTWQIDADQITLAGRNWAQTLGGIVGRAADGLGVPEPVNAQLYKLLIYDTGSFFIEHRDTEKADGMFATLVLVLPSIYSGGELLIGHGEREVCVNLAGADSADGAFVAFYADCVHAPVAPTAPRLALAPSSDAVKLIFAYCCAIKFVSSAHGRC